MACGGAFKLRPFRRILDGTKRLYPVSRNCLQLFVVAKCVFLFPSVACFSYRFFREHAILRSSEGRIISYMSNNIWQVLYKGVAWNAKISGKWRIQKKWSWKMGWRQWKASVWNAAPKCLKFWAKHKKFIRKLFYEFYKVSLRVVSDFRN